MASIFSKIITGELPSYKIAETENYLAFLDVFPLTKGHVLVIPKKETDNIFDIEEEEFAGLHLFSKIIASAVKQAVPLPQNRSGCYWFGSTSRTHSFGAY
jgi:histidine triad (HIT) family protein